MDTNQIKADIQGLRAALRQQQQSSPQQPSSAQPSPQLPTSQQVSQQQAMPQQPSPLQSSTQLERLSHSPSMAANRAPRPASPRPGSPAARAVGGPAATPGGGNDAQKRKPKTDNKSECVRRVEEMQKQREERRRKAEERKQRRAEEARDAEGRGGIECVDFLRKIKEHREYHNLTEQLECWGGGDIWDVSGSAAESSRIRVCVRKRPMLKVERLRHDFDVISLDQDHSALVVHEPRTRVDLEKVIESHRFQFDAVFNEADSNATIYGAALRPMLQHVLSGGSGTVFAFGQTGSGKTCTMAGHGKEELNDGNARGLYALAADDIAREAQSAGLSVNVSFFEVYRGQVLDLLGSRVKVDVLEDGKGRVQVVGLKEYRIASAAELLELVHSAEELRAVGATSANEQSSRSHAILQVYLRDEAGKSVGKLSLVDLAGSERAADASSKDRQTRIEGAEINKSLLCLKECIRSLDGDSTHIPFRGSKLTQVLRDSFVGRAKTAMIAAISPGSSAAEYTLNTLRYAQRVKEFSSKRPPAAVAAARRNPPSAPAAAAPAQVAGGVTPVAAPPRVPNSAHVHTPPKRTATTPRQAQTPMRGPTPPVSGRPQTPELAQDRRQPVVVDDDGQDELSGIDDLQRTLEDDGEEVGCFFKSITAVTRAEEELVAVHKDTLDESEQLMAQEKHLLADLRDADGLSVDEYATALEKVLHAKIKACMRVQDKVDELKKLLADEERVSANVKKVPLY